MCLPSKSSAANIIGVEFYYTTASSTGQENTYNIYLNLYYNHICGQPISSYSNSVALNARSPDPFDVYGFPVLLDSMTDYSAPEYPCQTTPIDLCFQKLSYSAQITLPVIDSSYYILNQWCCRYDSLSNLEPETTLLGISNYLEITSTAQQELNNMPLVNDSIPSMICANAPFEYTFDAIDTEGDQLVYNLCAPPTYDATSVTAPYPYPPFLSPPYLFPTYNMLSPLGNDLLTLDANTGELYAYPTTPGSYLVGICINEYRNGELLSTMTRDVVLTVVECAPQVQADIEADSINSNGAYQWTICDNTNLQLNNLSQNLDYIDDYSWVIDGEIYTDWSPAISFSGSGTFTGQLFLNPGQACADTANLIFYVVENMAIDFTNDYDTCIAGPVSLLSDVYYDGLSSLYYLWDFGDGQSSQLIHPQHYYDNPGTYTINLSVEDDFGCRDTLIQQINWQPAPAVIIVAPDTYEGCAPLTVQFDNKSWPVDSTYSIIWDFGDGHLQYEIDAMHEYSLQGVYPVGLSILSPIGCYVDTVFNDWIEITAPPRADFTYSPLNSTTQNKLLAFKDQSEQATFWEWHFGETDIAHYEQHPAYTFADTGMYQISLMVFDEYWCSDTIVKQIKVNPILSFYFPNAFTPNNDGLNDVFKTTGIFEALKFWQLSIWNRYGALVFESSNPDEGWNGLFKNYGAPSPQGVYTYRLHAIDNKQEKIELKGFCTLVR